MIITITFGHAGAFWSEGLISKTSKYREASSGPEKQKAWFAESRLQGDVLGVADELEQELREEQSSVAAPRHQPFARLRHWLSPVCTTGVDRIGSRVYDWGIPQANRGFGTIW